MKYQECCLGCEKDWEIKNANIKVTQPSLILPQCTFNIYTEQRFSEKKIVSNHIYFIQTWGPDYGGTTVNKAFPNFQGTAIFKEISL